ncbi:MAG: SCP2 sterol-binding domain-containing protein [Pseudomonadota bacterium]
MSEAFDKAVESVRERVQGSDVQGSYRFVIEDEGVIMIRDGAVSTEDGEADVTVKADLDTFREMFDGSLSPASAFMTGRVDVEGDMSQAMQLSALVG